MEVRRVSNDLEWDRRTVEWNGDFLQSWWWGEIARHEGREVYYFVAQEKDTTVAQIVVIERVIGLGVRSWYIAHGPLGEESACMFLIQHVRELAKKKGITFVHVEPLTSTNVVVNHSPIENTQPRHSLILDISPSIEEVMEGMHQKTRYNIRLSMKKGVEVREISWDKQVWNLFQETARRDGFSLHSEDHYMKMIESEHVILLGAYKDDVVLGAHILIIFGGRAVYSHGGSSNSHREYMAPYLLHYMGIQRAQEKGCKEYDFWGIDTHKWPGVTRFKKGFGGNEIMYPPAYSMVIKPLIYFLYRVYKKLRLR